VKSSTPVGSSEADWLATPVAGRGFVLAQQQENAEFRNQLTGMATELASLWEQIGRMPTTSPVGKRHNLQGAPAHRHHHPQTQRKGCLEVPGAGLDCP